MSAPGCESNGNAASAGGRDVDADVERTLTAGLGADIERGKHRNAVDRHVETVVGLLMEGRIAELVDKGLIFFFCKVGPMKIEGIV